MTDDQAFSDGLGSALLSAGRDEWPSDEAMSRTLAAVGAGAAVVTVATGVAGASASASTLVKGGATFVTFGSVMKWLGVGAVSGVVVAGVAHEVTAPPEPAMIAPPRAVVSPAPQRATKPLGEIAKPEPVVAPEPTVESPKPAVTAHPTPKEEDTALARAPLAAEVALVDRARAALSSGNAARALEELRGYETTFSDPRLQPEVLYLRMEAHLALGNTARAKATAEQSLKQFPKGPHVSRARAVVDGQL
jgi:hypothetical protein